METHATETTNSSAIPSVINTGTSETLEQLALPEVEQPHTIEASEPSPSSVTNMQISEASASQLTDTPNTTEKLEQMTTLPEAANAHEAEPLDDESIPSSVTNTQATEVLEQSTVVPLESPKATETMEQSVVPTEVTDNSRDNLIASPENHRSMEMRQETVEEEKQVRSILEEIAATGKFWYDWEKFRSMLSLHLKQVISEYPQTRMTVEEQKVSLGETHAELVKRLDDALHSFTDGPPFTVQRLSEIILDARSLYPNLSKLALALEKNLSVTSILAISTVPYSPPPIATENGLDKVTGDSSPKPQMPSDTVMENGVPPVAADRDEIMTEVEADVSEVMTMDVETTDKSSESSPMTTDIVDSSGVLVQPMGMSRL